MSQRVLPASIRVETKLEDKPLWFRADPTQFQQVVLNLVINARDAMDEGVIHVRLHSDDGWILIEVEDEGRGIPEGHHGRIFEPFFTTKDVGLGTGLGLPVARKLVAEWGGELTFESEMGVGTIFRVALPLASPSTTSISARRSVKLDGEGRCVLVVDDNPTVRRTVRELLHSANFTTIEAADGLQANETPRETYDIIVTDLMMPRMNGVEFIEEVRKREEEPPPTLLISGYADDETRRRVEASGITVLRKPFDQNGLLLGLVKALERTSKEESKT